MNSVLHNLVLPRGYYWVGAIDKYYNDTFIWFATGERLRDNSSLWTQRLPFDRSWNCALLAENPWFESGKLYKAPCIQSFFSICETFC